MAQGYQIIATGADRYLEMATACAASLRLFDGRRAVQLVTDRKAEAIARRDLFDVITPVDADATSLGPLVKLHSHRHSVFEETMFVDADCLLLKHDIDHRWSVLARDYAFATPGLWSDEGEWYGMDVAAMCAIAGTQRLVRMNSGTFYYRNSAAGHAVLDTAWTLFEELGNFTGHIHRGAGAPDEPFLALAMGRLGVDPFPMRDADCSSWMTATMNSLEVHADATSGAPRLVKHHRTLSPSLCHFTGLFPRDVYHRVAGDLIARSAGSLP
jgi:hypothetical protein